MKQDLLVTIKNEDFLDKHLMIQLFTFDKERSFIKMPS